MARKKKDPNAVNLDINRSTIYNRAVKRKGWLFLSPFVIGFVFYFIVIIVNSIRYSLSNIDVVPSKGLITTWNNFGNFKYAIGTDVEFNRILTQSVGNFLYHIPVILLFSLFIAVILNQKMRGRVFFRAMFFVPVILSTGLIDKVDYANAVLTYLSTSSGIAEGGIAEAAGTSLFSFEYVQDFTMALNLNAKFTEYILAAISNVVTMINQSGVQILIFLGGLQSISPSIYESAHVEGASGWESFWKITFPMISPMILVNLFYTIIDYFTRASSPMMIYIDKIIFDTKIGGKYGEGTAMAWIYFALIAVILVAIGFVVSRFIFYQQKD